MATPTGNLAKILAALRSGDGTCPELARRCGLPTRAVTNALHDQSKTMNPQAFKVDKSSNAPVWSLNRPAVKRSGIAPRYVPEFKELTPGSYDLWRGRDLALLGRQR